MSPYVTTNRVLRLRRNSTGRQSVLIAYYPVLAQGILGKGVLFVAPPLEDCITGLMRSSTQAGTDCADCQTLTRQALKICRNPVSTQKITTIEYSIFLVKRALAILINNQRIV